MSDEAKTVGLDDLRSEVRRGVGSQHSTLWLFMRQRYDALVTLIEDEGASWPVLAEGFERLGLTDKTGKPASAEVARQTFVRVGKFVAARRDNRPAKPPKATWPLASGEIAPGVRPVSAEAPAVSVPAQPEPAGMPDYLTEQLSVGQRHLTKRGT